MIIGEIEILRIQAFLLLISISITILFWKVVNKKIESEQEFSGLAWGISLSILGLGGIPGAIITVCVYYYISKKVKLLEAIEEGKNKKKRNGGRIEPYATYARRQLKDFLRIYCVCFVISLAIKLIIAFNIN